MKNNKWSFGEFLSAIKNSNLFKDQVVFEKEFTEIPPRYKEINPEFPHPIQRLLEKSSINPLYSHQVDAIEKIRSSQDVVVATPTASGKSLIYYLALLENYLKNPNHTYLFLFPLKALAQDQLKEFTQFVSNLAHDIKPPRAEVYDGDTPPLKRELIRKSPPQILITNPDMLHLGILPHHMFWKKFFENLRFIVVDEVHTYKGVMGSHMAWVFRRLIRISKFYGKDPTFILCSATIGNPIELIKNLIGKEPYLISKGGSPRGKQTFVFLNPALYGPAKTGFLLFKSAILRNLKTIVYTNSRKLTELIGMWTKKQLGTMQDKISIYRAGLLPEHRRDIEKRLMQGKLKGVVSTSALEAGINIGGLDVCILVGYPGSVMSTYQRAGRVGRKMQESGVIMIGGEDNLDQYFMQHPQKFFELSPEQVAINPYNKQIMQRHLMCAAFDLPIRPREFTHPKEIKCIQWLINQGYLTQDEITEEIFCFDNQIHKKTHLRSSAYNLNIFDEKGDIIGNIDLYRACHETYPGAIYLHNTISFKVKELNLGQRQVVCNRTEVKYFTKLITEKQTEILTKLDTKRFNSLKISFGDLKISEFFKGFEKRRIKDHTLINFIDLDMDPIFFETQGFWIEFPMEYKQRCEQKYLHFMGGIHGLEHLFIGAMPHIVLMDRNDIGGISQVYNEQLNSPVIFIYDGVPGGIGIAKEGYEKIDELLEIAGDILNSCECEIGCFRCIYSPKCGSGNKPLDKVCSVYLMDMIHKKQTTQKQNQPTVRNVFAKPKSFGVLDIETQKSAKEVGGWQNAAAMRVSCAVLYHSEKKEFLVFKEKDIKELFNILKELDLVIGFNIIKFDYLVLSAYSDMKLPSLPTLDLLKEVHSRLGYRVSLDNIAHATLNAKKSANGLLALKWFKQGKIDNIIKYCKKDVEITRDVYLFGKENGHIFFTNKDKKKVKLEINW